MYEKGKKKRTQGTKKKRGFRCTKEQRKRYTKYYENVACQPLHGVGKANYRLGDHHTDNCTVIITPYFLVRILDLISVEVKMCDSKSSTLGQPARDLS